MLLSTTKLAGWIQVDSDTQKTEDLAARERLKNSLQEHLEAVESLVETNLAAIEAAGKMICDALTDGHKILLCGNGGSAADAQHIAAELVGYYEAKRRSWPAVALTTDTSALTAISNDTGFESIFARQVEGLARKGDVLVAISTSGKSPNVLKAVETAQKIGCHTIALTGGQGLPLTASCDLSVVVRASRTSRIQEAHITIGHLWCEMVDLLTND